MRYHDSWDLISVGWVLHNRTKEDNFEIITEI